MPEPSVRAVAPADGSTCAAAVAGAEQQRPELAAGLAACWHSGEDAGLQARAVQALRGTHDAVGALVLADALRADAVAPPAALLAVRTIGELADAHSVPALVAARERLSDRVRDELDTALFNIAARGLIREFLVDPRVDDEAALRADPATAGAALRWLNEWPGDPRLHFAGAWIAGVCGDAAAVPALQRMVAEPAIGMQTVAAGALVRLGVGDGIIEPLLEGLMKDEMLLPSFVLAWAQAHPERARAALAEAFRSGNELRRETVAFIAGVLHDPALAEVVREGVGDAHARVRVASIWALGMLGSETARGDIEHARRDDPVEQVRDVAAASLGWINHDSQGLHAPHAGMSSDEGGGAR